MVQILIIAITIFVYFIPIYTFLPFQLNLRQTITLFFILSISILLMAYIPGNTDVVILLGVTGTYIALLEQNHIKNLCFFIIAYLFCVIFDSIFTFGINLLQIKFHSAQNSLPILIVYITLLYPTSKGAAFILHNKLIPKQKTIFPHKTWIIVAINLIICAIIYVFNIAAGDYIGYTPEITTFNGILLSLYFISSTAVIYTYIQGYIKQTELQKKQETFETLQQYTSQIENMYSSVRAFKHDYVNIMTSMSGYLEEKNLQGLSDYFYKEVLPLSNQATMQNFKLNQLMNIKLLELKSIVSSKLTYAYEIGVTVDIEVHDIIDQISMDRIDLARILGIFLDNAIEAALETEKPWIAFAMYQSDSSISILISNSFIDHGISCSEFNNPSVSTKGANRGIGLQNASQMIEKYPGTIWENEIKNNIFTQKLEIC
ncbi:MAG: GHKL domain-containing protein [Lachnospiraceae bacterium]|nr:GHKL domain-containing protein [Lachnospiraceae bacterium]